MVVVAFSVGKGRFLLSWPFFVFFLLTVSGFFVFIFHFVVLGTVTNVSCIARPVTRDYIGSVFFSGFPHHILGLLLSVIKF